MPKSIDVRLDDARMVIDNALNHPVLSKKMAAFGYHAKRMQEGKVLLEKAALLQLQQEESYNDQRATQHQLTTEAETLKAHYKEHLEIARFAFRKDPVMQEKLQLNGPRKRSWVGFTAQMQRFYTRIAPGIELMKKHGALEEEIAQAKTMVEAITTVRFQRLGMRGNAQQATQQRDEAIAALNTWVSGLKQVARVALQEENQLLEALGIVVPGNK